jgi:hypothetical protein
MAMVYINAAALQQVLQSLQSSRMNAITPILDALMVHSCSFMVQFVFSLDVAASKQSIMDCMDCIVIVLAR